LRWTVRWHHDQLKLGKLGAAAISEEPPARVGIEEKVAGEPAVFVGRSRGGGASIPYEGVVFTGQEEEHLGLGDRRSRAIEHMDSELVGDVHALSEAWCCRCQRYREEKHRATSSGR